MVRTKQVPRKLELEVVTPPRKMIGKHYLLKHNRPSPPSTPPSTPSIPPPSPDLQYKPDEEEKKDIPRAPFTRVVKEITGNEVRTRTTRRSNRRATSKNPGLRIRKAAVNALQTVTENYIENMFVNASLCATHRGRKTVTKKDVDLIAMITRK